METGSLYPMSGEARAGIVNGFLGFFQPQTAGASPKPPPLFPELVIR
jgi:hypothetical protein